MSDIERIIESIDCASEVEIMEFDFDDCFTALREMEYKIKNSTPSAKIQKIIDFYSSVTVNGSEAQCIRDVIMHELEMLASED